MSKPIICIDPGHGGHDSGAVGPNGLREKDVVLAVALMLEDMLYSEAKVILTRRTDVFVELGDRCKIANAAGAAVFLSVHCNSAKVPAAGIETFIAPTAGDSLGDAVQDALMDWFPERTNRGLKRAGFAVLKGTKMRAALAELEFIHTPAGEVFLADKGNQANFAKALAAGLRRALGIVPGKPVVTPVPEPQAWPAISVKAEIRRLAAEMLALAEKV
jgi:N-acetylmuramoyl-L-alanine amidase